MIDATNSLADIKANLQNYAVYKNHYADETAFNTAINARCDEVKREIMYDLCGKDVYTTMQTELKAGLLANYEETLYYAYWAEVYYTVAYFYDFIDRLDKAARIGYTETKSDPGGGSRMISGFSGKSAASMLYMERADKCMQMAGFDTQVKLKVRGSIHA